jgi:hypothetical protein
MWNWLIDLIPSTRLDVFAWRFGLLAILMPIFGGLCGWIALDIRNRSAAFKAEVDSQRGARLEATESELAKAKGEVANLKKLQEPWKLSADQMEKLRIELKGAPKGKVVVEYIRSDERRSRSCAEQIRDLLKQSGYDVWGYMAGFMQADATPLVGLQMSIKIEESRPVATGLQKTFKTIGLDAPIYRRNPQDTTYNDDQVVIWVGMKP